MAAKLFTCSACGRANSYLRDVCLHCDTALNKIPKERPEILEQGLAWFTSFAPQFEKWANGLLHKVESNLTAVGIGFALIVGLIIGSQLGVGQAILEPLPQNRTLSFQGHGSPIITEFQFYDRGIERLRDIEEMRLWLEEARDRAEEARDAADDAAFEANMRWVESGSMADFTRMLSADDAADQAEESLYSIDNALINLDLNH